jgi:hypothetical protein
MFESMIIESMSFLPFNLMKITVIQGLLADFLFSQT